jgi:hypothetical protein
VLDWDDMQYGAGRASGVRPWTLCLSRACGVSEHQDKPLGWHQGQAITKDMLQCVRHFHHGKTKNIRR